MFIDVMSPICVIHGSPMVDIGCRWRDVDARFHIAQPLGTRAYPPTTAKRLKHASKSTPKTWSFETFLLESSRSNISRPFLSTFLLRVDGKRANTQGCVRSPCHLPSAPVLRPGATDNEVVIRFFLIPACVASRVHHLVFPTKWLPWQQTKHRG